MEYPRFSIGELRAIEDDAREGLYFASDPARFLGVLIDVCRAYRSMLEDRLHHVTESAWGGEA